MRRKRIAAAPDGLVIVREGPGALADYGEVPISFVVSSRLRLDPRPRGAYGEALPTEPVDPPRVKDYDAIREEGPTRWAKRFDLTNWVVLSAIRKDRRVGGAVVAFDTPGVEMLENRRDLACLWDLRVRPELRGSGIGTRLVDEAVRWARERGCTTIEVETQDINVPACRFYSARGFVLRTVRENAYPECPDEAMLLWSMEL